MNSVDVVSVSSACPNCGAEKAAGAFCHQCGEQVHSRLSFRAIAATAARKIAQLDFALLRTFWLLSVRPGIAVREYVAGRRRAYTNPIKYAFLTATVYALVVNFIAAQEITFTTQVSRAVASLVPYLTFLVLLPLAALQRWLLRREPGYNTAECYVFLLFTWGQLFLGYAALAVAGGNTVSLWMPPQRGLRLPLAQILLYLALSTAYLGWATAQFHAVKLYIGLIVAWGMVNLSVAIGPGLAVQALAVIEALRR